jgi:Kef-type K+ transport system membrane component KefB
MKKNLLVYLLTILVFGAGIYLTLSAGKRLESSRQAPATSVVQTEAAPQTHAPAGGIQMLRENLRAPLSLLLLQLILIVLFARIFGGLFVKMGQPAVIGEMLAGIVLGPSVVGALFPGAFQFIFPVDSLGALRMLSQVGIILFMFVVGMELDVAHLRRKADTAILVSHISILFPYFLGVVFSYFIFRSFAPPNVPFLSFALFMGIAMSITAFPVLARIIEERGLSGTFLGTTAITCAAVGDVTAWGILAFVVALAKFGGAGQSVVTIVLAIAFIGGMFFFGRPVLNRLIATRLPVSGIPSRGTVVGILVLVFCSALFTEVIGVHALFGAFLAGVILPSNVVFRSHLREKLESFSSTFLLPLFFAFTGLRTQVGLLQDWQGWLVCAGLVAVATLGKLGGSMAAARWTGMNWHDSFCLGALMNTRGLVELIVLNVGYDLGILSARVFAMTIVMALVTTAMTGPLLSLAGILRRSNESLGARSRIA